MFPGDAVPPLTDALKDKDANARAGAAEAFGRIRRFTQSALPNLILLLKDKDADVRQAAAVAVTRITGGSWEGRTATPPARAFCHGR